MSPVAAVECGSAENFADEMGDGSKMLGRHIRKHGSEDRIGRNSRIEPHEQSFEPFYTADDAQGSGLGLAIASELAGRMAGRLSVRSAPGDTVFTLEIPA